MAKQGDIKRWNILIAEDDLTARAELLKSLYLIAHCTTVANGQEAIKAYEKSLKRKQPFDFILLDVVMPITDGFDVLRTIRQHEEHQTKILPQTSRIIMITSFKDSLMEHYNMGWDEYITKPIDTNILIKKMAELSNVDLLKTPA